MKEERDQWCPIYEHFYYQFLINVKLNLRMYSGVSRYFGVLGKLKNAAQI